MHKNTVVISLSVVAVALIALSLWWYYGNNPKYWLRDINNVTECVDAGGTQIGPSSCVLHGRDPIKHVAVPLGPIGVPR
jgi:hypothetical protein